MVTMRTYKDVYVEQVDYNCYLLQCIVDDSRSDTGVLM